MRGRAGRAGHIGRSALALLVLAILATAAVVPLAAQASASTAPSLATPGRAPSPGKAPPGALRAEFWVDSGGIPADGAPPALESVARDLVAEAAYVWAGNLFGFEFEWTPSDLSRGIEEGFSMRPVAAIEPGDPRLVPEDARKEGDRLSCYVSYAPDEAGLALLSTYGKAPWKAAQAVGRGDYAKGWAGRRAAYEDAARLALRELLRSLEPNKPRRVRGRIVLSGAPLVGVADGAYQVHARFRVEVVEVLGYGAY